MMTTVRRPAGYGAMFFLANCCFASALLSPANCMPRSTFGALLNWMSA
jgi:hypothetical protein